MNSPAVPVEVPADPEAEEVVVDVRDLIGLDHGLAADIRVDQQVEHVGDVDVRCGFRRRRDVGDVDEGIALPLPVEAEGVVET